MLFFFPILLTCCYTVLMLLYRLGWHKQSVFTIPVNFTPRTKMSIIIPARNETENIEVCLQSILKNNYPSALYEVIVVDDHSTDDTFEKVMALGNQNIQCIKLSEQLQNEGPLNSYKKKALEIAIAQSRGDVIVTTDADCIVPANWLLNIAACYEQSNAVMIIGAVDFISSNSVLSIFQSLDFMSMQGITVAAHTLGLGNMSNGANLIFSKSAFNDVEGYNGINHLASGDDYLLMMKMQNRFPKQIDYLKTHDAIVRTAPQQSWGDFLNQRVRWASKSGKYDDHKLTAILMGVYLFNCSFIFLFIASFLTHGVWQFLVMMLIAKTIVELIYLYPVAQFFDKRKQLWLFPFLQPLHISYIILAGLMGFVGVYSWKGRRVK